MFEQTDDATRVKVARLCAPVGANTSAIREPVSTQRRKDAKPQPKFDHRDTKNTEKCHCGEASVSIVSRWFNSVRWLDCAGTLLITEH